MSNIRIGAYVQVNDPNLVTYGKCGKVTFTYSGGIANVLLETGRSITIGRQKLRIVNAPSTRVEQPKNQVIAYFYEHDDDVNPTSFEEIENDFGLSNPDTVFYGTIDKVKENIRKAVEESNYESHFIIMNNQIFPIEKEIHIKIQGL